MAAIYADLIEGADKEQREKIDDLIFSAPKSLSKDKLASTPDWSVDEIGNSFLASMGMGNRGNGGRAN